MYKRENSGRLRSAGAAAAECLQAKVKEVNGSTSRPSTPASGLARAQTPKQQGSSSSSSSSAASFSSTAMTRRPATPSSSSSAFSSMGTTQVLILADEPLAVEKIVTETTSAPRNGNRAALKQESSAEASGLNKESSGGSSSEGADRQDLSSRSKYLEEYARNVRTPRAQSARGHSNHGLGGTSTFASTSEGQAKEKDGPQGNKSSSTGSGGGGGGGGPSEGWNNGSHAEDDDVFDCLPLSAWSDDTLIGLPTSYSLYDKFEQLSTARLAHLQEHQRASSAKPSGSKKFGSVANRLVSSSKGPRTRRDIVRSNFMSQGQNGSGRDRNGFKNNASRVYLSVEPEEDPEDKRETSSSMSSISDWPNSLRIVVPYKLKTKQKGAHALNPNLHSTRASSRSSESNNGTNYYGYHSRPISTSIPSALRVQQQRDERERSVALAKAKLLSNYRNKHHSKVHENEEPLAPVISRPTTTEKPTQSITHHRQSWRK